MADELRGGTKQDFADSLASMIEAELNIALGQYGLDPIPSESRNDLRPLILGIARGIVRYIGDHAGAFVIDDAAVGGLGSHDHGAALLRIDTDPT